MPAQVLRFDLPPDTLLDDVAWSLDGRRLVAAADRTLVALDTGSGDTREVATDGPVASLALTVDGARCAWVPVVGVPVVADLGAPGASPTRLAGLGSVARVVFHPDGRHLAVASGQVDRPRVELRRIEDGGLRAAFACETPAHLLDLSPDGRHLAWAEVGGAVRIARLDAASGPTVVCAGDRRPTSLGDGVVGLRVAGPYAWLAEPGGALQRVDVAADRLDPDWLPADEGDLEARPFALSPGGRFVARGLAGRVEVFDTQDASLVFEAPANEWGAYPVLPGDGRLLVVDPDGGRVEVLSAPALVDPAPPVTPAPDAEVGALDEPGLAAEGLTGEARPIHRDLLAELRDAPDLDEPDRDTLIGLAPALAGALAAAASLRRAAAARRLVERARRPQAAPPLPGLSGRAPADGADLHAGVAAWEGYAALWWQGLRERTAMAAEDAVEALRDQADFDLAWRAAAARVGWTPAGLVGAIRDGEGGAATAATIAVAVAALSPSADLEPLVALAADDDAATGDRAAAVLALRALGAGERADHAVLGADLDTAEAIADAAEWLSERAWDLAPGR